jgi:hypothetical protein
MGESTGGGLIEQVYFVFTVVVDYGKPFFGHNHSGYHPLPARQALYRFVTQFDEALPVKPTD